ncbi:MAG: hypothetical protein CL908_01240, partial [Deltaproteobacteria bacterium]|nr:hypothetical protein [Deltaproteobacteria bacterium]
MVSDDGMALCKLGVEPIGMRVVLLLDGDRRRTQQRGRIVEEPFTRIPPFRPEPDMSSVREAIRLLVEAERPVIVAGGGVTASSARQELVELANRL